MADNSERKLCTFGHPKRCTKCDAEFSCYSAFYGEPCELWTECYSCYVAGLDKGPLDYRKRALDSGNV